MDEPVDVRVVIVDDHRVFAESLRLLLENEPDIQVAGIATDGLQGIHLVQAMSPDVALVDYQMPGQDGIDTAAAMRAVDKSVNVVMLTASDEDRVLLRAIEAGCSGYITKDRAAAEVADAVRAAAAGEALISPAVLARLLPRLQSAPSGVGSDLTEREREVLALMARGETNKAIAAELFLSVNTIRNYVQSILTKLGVHSKLEAVTTAVREGIVEYD